MSRSETARERWARIIQEQRASGLSVAAFCDARSMPSSSLFAWKRKLADAGEAAGVFVEAKVDGLDARAGTAAGGVAVELGHGVRVVVARGFDRGLLREVIQALRSGAAVGS